MIQLNQVGIGYQKEILRANDIFLESGKVYALVGRNGIGKSTFIQTLIGQQKVLSGDIWIDQRTISTFSSKELSETIALVETRFEGVEYLTVRDYLALGRAPFTDAFGRMTSEDWEIVQKTAADLSIGHLLDKHTDCISDGERQLCAVGRAFVQETPIILLDEPTAFLDYINRNKLLEILVALASKKNKCIILSTHDIDLCLDQAVPLLLAASSTIELFSSLSKDEILNAMY